MGFGLNDESWLEPEEGEERCRDCEEWEECPSRCGWGWCRLLGQFTEGGAECDM